MYPACLILVIVIISTHLLNVAWCRIIPVSKCIDTDSTPVGVSAIGLRTFTEITYFENYLDYIPEQPLLALQGFSLGSSVFDFDISLKDVDNTKFTFELQARDGCRVLMICFSALFAKDETIVIIPYDFSTHQQFGSLSSGIDAQIEYTVNYTPENPSLFTSASGYIALTGIKVESPTNANYTFQNSVVSAASNSFIFRIKKFGDTAITRLVGYLFLVSSTATSKFGFKSFGYTQGPPTFFNWPDGWNVIGTGIGGTANLYQGGIPKSLIFLKGISVDSALPRFRVETHNSISMDSSVGTNTMYSRLGGSDIHSFSIDIQLLCEDDSCLLPAQAIMTGGIFTPNFVGSSMYNPGGFQSNILTFGLDKFLASSYIYVGVGLSSFNCIGGCEVLWTTANQKTLTLQYKGRVGEKITRMHTAYIVSSWRKAYSVNFASHGSFYTFIPTQEPRRLTYIQSFNPHADLGNNIQAFIMFSAVAFPVDEFYLDYEFTLITANDLTYDLILSGYAAPSQLKGFIIIYNGNSGLGNSYRLSSYTVRSSIPFSNYGSVAVRNTNTKFLSSYMIPPLRLIAFNKMQFDSTNEAFMDIRTRMVLNSPDCSTDIISTEVIPMSFYNSGYTVMVFYPTNTGMYYTNYGTVRTLAAINPAVPQIFCIQNNFVSNNPYGLIVADSSFFYMTPYFKNPLGKNPRILGIFKVQKIDDSVAIVTVPSLPIHEKGIISHHVVELRSNTFDWMILGYNSDYFDTFPRIAPTHAANLGNVLPYIPDYYQTMIASKLITHSESSAFSCDFDITFIGIMRGCYFNSVFILSGSSIDLAVPKTIRAPSKLTFKPGEYSLLTVIGHFQTSGSIEFSGCTYASGGNPLTPAFSMYHAPQSGFTFDIKYNANAGPCPTFCKSCDFFECLECVEGTLLSKGVCVVMSICTDDDYLVPVRGKYCMSKPASAALSLFTPIYDEVAKTLKAGYSVHTYRPVLDVVMIYFPFRTSYGNHPILLQDISTPTLGEASYKIMRFSPENTKFSMTETCVLDNIMEIPGEVQIVGYSLKVNNYLVVTVEPSNNKRATEIIYTTSFPLFDSTKKYIMAFFADFSAESIITLSLHGSAKIVLNHRTELFSADYQTEILYPIFRKVNGLVHFQINLQNIQRFTMSFSVNPMIFAPSDFLFEDSVILQTGTPCYISNCINCNSNGQCLSCESGRYLTNMKDECSSECMPESLNNDEERICRCMESTQCTSYDSSRCNESTGKCESCLIPLDCSHIFPLQVDTFCYLGACLECIANCKRCTTPSICDECLEGFPAMGADQCGDDCGDGRRDPSILNGKCDDGNVIDGDGCSAICDIEPGYACFGATVSSPDVCYSIPTLQVSQKDDPKIILLVFSKPMMVIAQDLEELMLISLSNIQSTNYEFSIVQINPKTFEIHFQAEKTLNSNELTITFTNPSLVIDVDSIGIANEIYTISISPMIFESNENENENENEDGEGEEEEEENPSKKPSTEREENLMDDTQRILTTIAVSGLASSGAALLAGTNSSFVWFFLAILQKYYYLLFLNIDYPENFKSFLQVLTFARLDFLPNGPSIFSPDLTKQSLPSSPHFAENQMNGLFILNSGSMLTMWFVWILIGISLKSALVFANMIPKAILKYIRRKYRKLVWSGLMRNWMATFFDLTISAFLQIKVLSWDTGVRGFSSLLAILVVLVNTIILFGGFALVKVSKRNPAKIMTVANLVDELKPEPGICRYYNPILLTRRLIAAIIIVFCYDYPFIQIFVLIIVDSFHLLFMITKRPYKGKGEQLAIIIDECLYFLIYMLIAIMKSMNDELNDDHDDNLSTVGWVTIGACLTGLFVTGVLLLSDIYKTLKELYEKHFKAHQKPHPISKRTIKRKKIAQDNSTNKQIPKNSLKEDKIRDANLKRKVIRVKTRNIIVDHK